MSEKKEKHLRTERLTLRFSKEELDFINLRKSQHNANGYSDFVLSVIANQKCYIVDTKPLLAVAAELNSIGTNINQIAKVANITRSVYEKDIIRLKERVEELQNAVSRYYKLTVAAKEGKLNGLHEDNPD
ncbi:MAG: plasmid mobilization relaxosome protein MobC [Firmicutes bacterium]|nr:plasmid mobilization relaxosome protein MobC [Bacillota bacterium]